jgi:biotin-dependent carboxylase-like uncharacterized protein
MGLRLLEPGLATWLVDLGRPGWRHLGVPQGGPADRTSFLLGNALVGNPPDTAALEITLRGPTLEADCDLACVLFGAPFEIFSERQRLHPGETFTLHAGERLRIGSPREGLRAYFCVRGGLEAPRILGSRSGLAPLPAGIELPCFPGKIGRRFLRKPDWPSWPGGALPAYLGRWRRLRVLPGPQADWFPSQGLWGLDSDSCPALPRRFTVSPASNRMGIRLRADPLPVPDRELLSEPVCPGSVQVTRDGQCLILGVDCQTIGGYPKIAQVIRADLDLLGQLRPGEQVFFQEVTLEEAETAYRQQQTLLHDWQARLRALSH